MSAIFCDKCLKDKLIYILRTLGTESQHRCSRGYLIGNVEPAYVNKKDNRAAIILNTYCSLLNWHVKSGERESTFLLADR